MNRQTIPKVILKGICLAGLFVFTFLLSGEAKPGESWEYFHGPRGDNISKETGLLKAWPENGPKLLWTVEGLGKGYSSVVIADRMIFTAGASAGSTYVFALDYKGKIKWKKPNGKKWEAGSQRWARDYDGARATPTFNDGLVYHLGELGSLSVFKAADGSRVWSIDIAGKFSGQVPRYGYSESLLIDGNHLICSPGGPKGYMVALNKKTGKTIWANTDINEEPGYNSPILVEDRGLRQIITMTTLGVVAVNADTGELLWKMGLTNKRKLNIANPFYRDGYVCISSGYGGGTMLIKLTYKDKKVTAQKVWFNEELDNHHGGIMCLNDYVYGTGHNRRGWICLDFKTGKTLFRDREAGKGSFMLADGLFYYLTEKGMMNLVKPSPGSFQTVGGFQVPKEGRGYFWAHPVVCDGRLYVRYDTRLYAYRVKK